MLCDKHWWPLPVSLFNVVTVLMQHTNLTPPLSSGLAVASDNTAVTQHSCHTTQLSHNTAVTQHSCHVCS